MEGTDKDKPKWRIDGKIAKQLSDARKFVEQNYNDDSWKKLPLYVERYYSSVDVVRLMATRSIKVTSGIEFHYINCPSCDGRAYRNSKVNPPREME